MGELFVNQHEYVPLIRDRLIDFIRVHISDIGGLTPARKLAALCEFFGVRTAWHGPGDVSPVGHAANLQLDLASHELRHPGGEPVRRAHEGGVPRLPGGPRRRDVVERAAGPGHRRRRGAGREVPVPGAPDQRGLAGDPPPRRDGPEAVNPLGARPSRPLRHRLSPHNRCNSNVEKWERGHPGRQPGAARMAALPLSSVAGATGRSRDGMPVAAGTARGDRRQGLDTIRAFMT